MLTFLASIPAGISAQLIDGSLGMGFGATATTLLLLIGVSAPAASAIIHTAELGTTLASGIAHWRYGNVDWPAVVRLALPGSIGAFMGAVLLGSVSLHAAAPLTALILAGIGARLVWRFSRGRVQRTTTTPPGTTKLIALGGIGGFVDAAGGGGWGPITTSTLLHMNIRPRTAVGTANTAEFLVACGATAGFFTTLGPQLFHHLGGALGLLIGGVIAAPIAAKLVSHANPAALGGIVGTVLVALNIPRVLVPLHTPPWALITVITISIAIGAWLTRRGVRRRTYNELLAARGTTDVQEPTATPAVSAAASAANPIGEDVVN